MRSNDFPNITLLLVCSYPESDFPSFGPPPKRAVSGHAALHANSIETFVLSSVSHTYTMPVDGFFWTASPWVPKRKPTRRATQTRWRVSRGAPFLNGATFHSQQQKCLRRRVRSSLRASAARSRRQVCRSGAKLETFATDIDETNAAHDTEQTEREDAKLRTLRDRGLQLPSYARADLDASLAELKTVEGIAGGHADDATMLWFLKDRSLDVEARLGHSSPRPGGRQPCSQSKFN